MQNVVGLGRDLLHVPFAAMNKLNITYSTVFKLCKFALFRDLPAFVDVRMYIDFSCSYIVKEKLFCKLASLKIA